ncbi:MAG TPA: carboxypeptidase-like regulatory domain-containing protein, partial [Pyrinomonadaceae bacterium]|nr:carboxypeptidase-like regulatory domain-containing protein [Pyrinomonadaceae bacterium]
MRKNDVRNPDGVARDQNGALSQRSRCAATLGFVTQPLRGWGPLVLTLILSTFTFAQNSTSITGHITDEHNAAVAGAEVQLRSRSGAHLLLIADDHGNYLFKYVVPGDYV